MSSFPLPFRLPIRTLLLLGLLLSLCAVGRSVTIADSPVVLTEINYHPAGSDSEWIELHCLSGVNVDLSGWTIQGGISYTFPEGTIINGRGYLVLAANPGAGNLSGVSALGPYTGSLSNSAAEITVVNRNGRVMDDVSYQDSDPWPVGPDGSGATLSKRNFDSGDENSTNWTWSTDVGGTPGADNFGTVGEAPVTTLLTDLPSTWSYFDSGAPPAGWNAAGFDDSTWSSAGGVFYAGNAQTTGGGADLLGYWPLNEGSGTVAYNQVNGGVDGTLMNSPAWVTDPVHGTVLQFTGTSQTYVSVGSATIPQMTTTNDFTWAFWANSAETGTTNNMVGNRYSPNGQPWSPLEFIKFTTTMFEFYHNGGQDGVSYGTDLPVNVWAHHCVVKNGAVLDYYRNGALLSTHTITGGLNNPQPLYFGGDQEYWTGLLSQVAIWTRALAASEVSSLAAGTQTPATVGASGPLVTQLPLGQTTYYFSGAFNYAGSPARTTLNLRTLISDGAVIYLNGTEIYRQNMPAGTPSYDTLASSTVPVSPLSALIPVSASTLVKGTNVLAVEVHEAAASTSMVFGLQLTSSELAALAPDTNPSVVINEMSPGGAGFQLDLANVSAAPVNLAGLTLVSSAGPSYALPDQDLDAGAFLVLDAATLGFTPASGDKLFLYSGNGASLLDAQKVSKKLRGRAPSGQWLYPAVASFGSANVFAFNTAIVINEIMYQPPPISQTPYVPSTEQWIELYNRSGVTVSLANWTFDTGVTYTFPTNTIIPAGGYLVVSNNAAALQAKWPAVASKIIGNFTGSLSGKGEEIELSDANGNPVNAVTYSSGGDWPAAANGGGSSLELTDPRGDNTQSGAWAASNESARGSWQTYTFSGVAADITGDPVQWNEFDFGLLDVGTYLIGNISVIEDPGGENRQLILNGNFTGGSTTGWRFLGTQSRATVVPDPANAGNMVLQVISTGPTEHMHNHIETTLQSGGSLVTINPALNYQVSFQARWVSGNNELNSRLYFNRDAASVLLPVAPGGGTPGMPNSTAVANAGPTSSGFIHSPAVPAAGQSATVTISNVSDPDGVASVTLFYAVNGGSFVSAPMAAQGGGTYTAVVPGQATGTTVQFYVQAVDGLGASSFFPAAGPNSRAMIPWEDGQSLLSVNGVQPTNLRIVMTAADIVTLYTVTNVMSNDPMPCTVIADETNIYYGCGVHMHGSERGRDQPTRVSFHLIFPPDNLFLGVHDNVIMDRSGGGDVSSQSEIMIKHAITHASGIPGSEDDLCHVIAPESANTGPAILIKEDFDSNYLAGQYANGSNGMEFGYEYIYYPLTTTGISGDTGNVQDLKYPEPDNVIGVPMSSLGTDKELYRWHWLVEDNVSQDDFSGLMTWLTAYGNPAGTQYYTDTANYMDVDEWLRSFAIEMLFGIGDNYGGGNVQHNAIVYQRPADGRFIFFPHDMDFIFSNGATSSLTSNPDQQKLMGNPGNARAFWGHVQDICNTTYNTTYMTPWAVHYTKFLNEDLTTYLSYISQSSAYALSQVASAIPAAAFAITTPNGTSFSGNLATITGTGPVNLRELTLAGASTPLTVTWTTTTAWQVSLPISTGVNNLTINATDFEGAPIGTQSVSVIGTGVLVPASAANMTISKVMYHPVDPSPAELTAGYTTGDDFEYLEVMNIGSNPIDLTGVEFTTGVTYSFVSGLQLAGGARLVVPNNNAAFVFRYGSSAPLAAGGFGPTTKLSNSGEQIGLVDASGVDIKRFTYSDSEPWPTGADGSGPALVLINPLTNPDVTQPANWRLSAAAGGSPGVSDAEQFSGNPTGDSDNNGVPNFLQYAIAGATPYVPPAVSIVAGETVIQFNRNLAADDAVLSVQSSIDLVNWSSLPAGYSTNSEVPDGNGESTITITGPSLSVPALFFRVEAAQVP